MVNQFESCFQGRVYRDNDCRKVAERSEVKKFWVVFSYFSFTLLHKQCTFPQKNKELKTD